MKIYLSSFVSGLIFAIGLGFSGMMDPIKVQGFLDLAGKWDPSLALVMGGAVTVTFLMFPLIFKRKAPLLGGTFNLPTSVKIDKPLIGGALLFGIGWAISGLCPGPALANVATLNIGVLAYVVAMTTGWIAYQKIAVMDIRSHASTPKEAQKSVQDFCDEQCVVD
jgi:uncharacterized membrane protein YedE/YeeE